MLNDNMNNIRKAVFAGGCFWCMVKPFHNNNGVIRVLSGYTGGHTENPTYEEVCTDATGHMEAVEVTYYNDKTSYRELVNIFFKNIDPTDEGGQFNDRGYHYKTAIFYSNEEEKNIAEDVKLELQNTGKFSKPIVTKILPAKEFYKAEDYHQDYYKKNKLHYNMYFVGSGRATFIEKNWSQDKENLRGILTPLQFEVTQNNGTESPFENEYYDNFEEGIYVDIIDGTPLFSSKDKFESGCGWPSFSKPIEMSRVIEKSDYSYGMIRTEVRSAKSNSHLGHVFTDGPEDKGGLRYCINSAALRFIPKEKFIEKGYEECLKYV